jgi:hypothetical protein
MHGWATFWGIVLLSALGIFACVSLVVSVGGFSDVLAMLRRIRESHEGHDE